LPVKWFLLSFVPPVADSTKEKRNITKKQQQSPDFPPLVFLRCHLLDYYRGYLAKIKLLG
jgi:hypothetical protein